MTNRTASEAKAALDTVLAISEALRALGTVPSGEFYARILGSVSFENYVAAIALLKRAGLVSESAHVLAWTGPKISPFPWKPRTDPIR